MNRDKAMALLTIHIDDAEDCNLGGWGKGSDRGKNLFVDLSVGNADSS